VAGVVSGDLFTATGLDGRASYAPERTEQLWAEVPAVLRLERYTPATIPAEHQPAFASIERCSRLDLTGLSVGWRHEFAWSVAGIVARGGKVPIGPLALLARHLPTLLEDLGGRGIDACSVMHFSPSGWEREFQRLALKHGRPELSVKSAHATLRRIYRPLWIAYDPRPWWQREVWDPHLDSAIPLRAYEPAGEKLLSFLRLEQDWLRAGAQWWFKVSLELERLTWSTLRGFLNALDELSGFLTARGIEHPWLCERPAEVRVLMLDFLGEVKSRKVKRGPTEGQPLSGAQVANHMVGVEAFYRFMHDEREQAAVALGERRWRRLGPEHTRFWRYGEKPKRHHPLDERELLTDAAFAQIMAGLHVLGDPASESGMGDEQAMRALMLLARTGRRLNEILLLDFDPLIQVDGLPPAANPGGALVAKLRYQQTKIDDAPNTIFVDEEIVAIIRSQQEWARDRISTTDGDIARRYLFVLRTDNRFGARPYTDGSFQQQLSRLVRRLDLRDDAGRPIDFRRTHRFRHTRATSLLNAGVPLHVVQRYLGHLSPRMTMHYAQTLAATHEREFLRFHKITADARDLTVDPRDLYDLLELDQRADRVLPNGYCMLPPRQVCERGNACLTCDKFATDASFLTEHEQQLGRLVELVEHRQRAFLDRTGQAMSAQHVWLQQRDREQHALGAIICRLKQPESSGSAIRGAGTSARTSPTET
jgi:integrase